MKHLITVTYLVAAFLLMLLVRVNAQDLLAELEEMEPEGKEFTYATFKGTRLVNGHSIETKNKGELEFIISHRFGTLNSGAYNLWGLDAAYIRIGLEYGITDELSVGIGRSSFNKIYDGYLKYKVLRQSTGPGSIPITLTAFASTAIQTFPQKASDPTVEFTDRLTYTYQVLIARKFSPELSLQVAPVFMHSNRVDQPLENNDIVALGFGGRHKLTKSLSINGEYYLRLNPHPNSPYYDLIAIGFDLETGGHVFQFILSNTQGMVERTFVSQTAGNFFDGDIHFGFNITRTFQVVKPKLPK